MDNEKIQRALEFILENQAQFTVDIQKLGEANSIAEKRINTLERATLNLYNSMIEQSKNVTELAETVKELRNAQKETDDRLNAVILMIERYLSGENGKSQ